MHGGFWRCVRPLQPCFARSTAERMPLLRHVASALRPLHVGHKQPPPKTARCMAASRPARVARAEHCADAVLLLAALHARDQLPAAPGSRAARASLPYACSSALPGAGRGRAGAPVQRADEVLLQAALHAHDQEVHDRLGHCVLQARAHERKVALHQQPRHLHLHLLLLRRADRHAQRLRARASGLGLRLGSAHEPKAALRQQPRDLHRHLLLLRRADRHAQRLCGRARAAAHALTSTHARQTSTPACAASARAPALPLTPDQHACTAGALEGRGGCSQAAGLEGIAAQSRSPAGNTRPRRPKARRKQRI